jgi:hypothetical protein
VKIRGIGILPMIVNHIGWKPMPHQAIERTTPPSARTDTPLIAEAKGLQTNATTFAISIGSMNRFKIEVGRAL